MARHTVYEDQLDEESNCQDEHLQVVANLSEEVKKQEQYALAMERLQDDVEDIHSVFQDLSQLVNVSRYILIWSRGPISKISHQNFYSLAVN